MTAAAKPGQAGGAQQELQMQPAGQLGCGESQQPPQTSIKPQQEWRSVWQPAVTTALVVRP